MLITTKKVKLLQLKVKLEKDFKKLPLVKKVADIVPPEGNPDAEIFFIGEAAGYHELLQRRPFVGAAGKLLSATLAENAMPREDVWISNVVKARPPQNRDPKPEEIEAFRPYLDAEIEIIKPKIIVTLGRFSLAKFIPNVYISMIHGQPRWIDWKNERLLIFPMYHPAAALRSDGIRQLFKQDFKKLTSTLATLKNQIKNEEEKPFLESENEKHKEDVQLQLVLKD